MSDWMVLLDSHYFQFFCPNVYMYSVLVCIWVRLQFSFTWSTGETALLVLMKFGR